MYKVKDQNGNFISGIVKSDTGNLIVTNKKQYYKYIRERDSAKKIVDLENEVEELKGLIHSLLNNKNE